MNNVLKNINPMNRYKTSLRRNELHRGLITAIETHAPFGEEMECAIVDLEHGLKGMIHENQFDTYKYKSLAGFIDHMVDFMVFDVKKANLSHDITVFDEKEGVILLSRVQALQELQEEFWETADVNHVITGVVSGFENERLYIEYKGVVCVLPIEDYEYDWTPSGKNLLPLGSQITVKIKKINRDKQHVTVTRKELLEDPWLRVRERFKINDAYRGVISSVVPNIGIFVKLAPGVESLAPFPQRIPNVETLEGKTVAVRIKNIRHERKRISSKIINFPHEVY